MFVLGHIQMIFTVVLSSFRMTCKVSFEQDLLQETLGKLGMNKKIF